MRSFVISVLLAIGALGLPPSCAANAEWYVIVEAGNAASPVFDWLWVGAGQGASDGYDSDDQPRTRPDGPINIGIYHASGEGWSGPEGFYGLDLHAPVTAQSTWANIYLWWGPPFESRDFPLYVRPHQWMSLPPGFRSVLYLDEVPAGVTYNGLWQWDVPLEGLEIPAGTFTPFESSTGLDSYKFHYTVVIPEPASIAGLAGGLGFLCLTRRRKASP